MRKEVRSGAAIGGILVIVLSVYFVVVSRNSNNKKERAGAEKTPTDTTANTGGTERAPADSHPEFVTPTPAPTDTPAGPSTNGPAAGSPSHPDDAGTERPAVDTSPWHALLAADHVEGLMPGHTHTPDAIATATATPSTPAAAVPSAPPTPPVPDVPAHADVIQTPESRTTHGPELPTAAPRSINHESSEGATAADGSSQATGSSAKTHKIEPNETFSSIARSLYGNAKYYKLIMEANPKLDPTRLRPGMMINLPDRSQIKREAAAAASASAEAGPTPAHHAAPAAPINSKTEYRVQSNDNLYNISIKLYHTPNKVDELYQLNKDQIGSDPGRLKLNMILKLPSPPSQQTHAPVD